MAAQCTAKDKMILKKHFVLSLKQLTGRLRTEMQFIANLSFVDFLVMDFKLFKKLINGQ